MTSSPPPSTSPAIRTLGHGSRSDRDPRCSATISPSPRRPRPGVGPGLVLAIDNTLGSFSPHQGRIYAAYVVYVNSTIDPNSHVNPTTNTDIFLAYSDNGGRTWSTPALVNDDDRPPTVHSGESTSDSDGAHRSGHRPDAVPAGDRGRPGDRDAGPLVARRPQRRRQRPGGDLHHHQHRRRQYFSPRPTPTRPRPRSTRSPGRPTSWARRPTTSRGGNRQADTASATATRWAWRSRWPGLPGLGGQLQRQFLQQRHAVVADPLNIWYRPMVIAAGPRIINSTMGPIPLAEAAAARSASPSPSTARSTAASVKPRRCPGLLPRHHQRRSLRPAHGDELHSGH